MFGIWPRRLMCCGLACLAMFILPSRAYTQASKSVGIVDGWRVKSRSGSDGAFLTCSMDRTFVADRGSGNFRINLIVWRDSVSVLLRGNEGFLRGSGIAQLDVISGGGDLFSGDVSFQNSELLFVIRRPWIRNEIKTSPGWALRMNGKPFVKFPLKGARAAMTAVESCAKLPSRTIASDDKVNGVVASWSSNTTETDTMQQLLTLAQNFSAAINRPGYHTTGFDAGVLQWSYDDEVASGAASIVTQDEPAATYASRLAIRADQCDDSVLTLPVSIAPYLDGERATVVSMCREDDGVRVRHIHVVKRENSTTYVLNFEDRAALEGHDIPDASGVLNGAFQKAMNAAIRARM